MFACFSLISLICEVVAPKDRPGRESIRMLGGSINGSGSEKLGRVSGPRLSVSITVVMWIMPGTKLCGRRGRLVPAL
ncbi:hypothetical protein EDB86DRAFT_2979001 [Lactarius hatsudake]|nr:hypothetical protein EDB86DRAFT_2979001 [Lactarius hatsudake]